MQILELTPLVAVRGTLVISVSEKKNHILNHNRRLFLVTDVAVVVVLADAAIVSASDEQYQPLSKCCDSH